MSFAKNSTVRHAIQAKLRDFDETVSLLNEWTQIVKVLTEKSPRIIVVGPQPRYPVKCCDDGDHFPKEYDGQEYAKDCYDLASFMAMQMVMEGVFMVHPGDVFGWGTPSVGDLLSSDLVHLNAQGQYRKLAVVLGLLDTLREHGDAQPDRLTGGLTPAGWPAFKKGMSEYAKKCPDASFQKPKFFAPDTSDV